MNSLQKSFWTTKIQKIFSTKQIILEYTNRKNEFGSKRRNSVSRAEQSKWDVCTNASNSFTKLNSGKAVCCALFIWTKSYDDSVCWAEKSFFSFVAVVAVVVVFVFVACRQTTSTHAQCLQYQIQCMLCECIGNEAKWTRTGHKYPHTLSVCGHVRCGIFRKIVTPHLSAHQNNEYFVCYFRTADVWWWLCSVCILLLRIFFSHIDCLFVCFAQILAVVNLPEMV